MALTEDSVAQGSAGVKLGGPFSPGTWARTIRGQRWRESEWATPLDIYTLEAQRWEAARKIRGRAYAPTCRRTRGRAIWLISALAGNAAPKEELLCNLGRDKNVGDLKKVIKILFSTWVVRKLTWRILENRTYRSCWVSGMTQRVYSLFQPMSKIGDRCPTCHPIRPCDAPFARSGRQLSWVPLGGKYIDRVRKDDAASHSRSLF